MANIYDLLMLRIEEYFKFYFIAVWKPWGQESLIKATVNFLFLHVGNGSATTPLFWGAGPFFVVGTALCYIARVATSLDTVH